MAEAEYIKKTQDTLGTIVKKPPLTDKLLAKPPFRFLHDILMAVVKNTGFMEGLYSGDELDSAQVNDKDKKVAFLQKAIDLVQLINGETLSVKPGKIVAGQEPDKTNEFLQALARALKKQPNSTEFVQRVLNGGGGDANSSAGSNKENKKSRSGSKEKKDDKTVNKEEPSSKDSKTGSKPRSASKEGRESSAKTSSKRENSSERISKSSKEKSDDQLRTKSSSSKERKEAENDDKKSSDKKSSSAKDKDKKSSSSKDEKKSKKAEESDEKKDDTKKHKSKKKQEDKREEDDDRTAANPNHLSTLSMNGSEESSSATKKGKLKIDLSKKNEPNGSNDGDHEIDDRPLSPQMVSKPAVEGRRASVSAKEGTRPTLSAIDGRKDGFQPEDDEGLVKPGVIRQTRSARPATASSTTARPGTAAGRPSTVKQDSSSIGIKRREITMEDKKLARNDSIVHEQQQVVRKVITEANGGDNEDDDNFIIDDRDGSLTVDSLLNDRPEAAADDDLNERDDHGQLVRKILETKKGLENQMKADGSKLGDKTTVVVYDVKEKEKTKQECQKLHDLVQQLTRNSHPLGKIVDFLQEDVDSMLKELQQWRQEYKVNMTSVRQQLGSDGGQLEPLKSKLNELDQQINEQMDAITAVRGRMLVNEDKIQKLLVSVAKK